MSNIALAHVVSPRPSNIAVMKNSAWLKRPIEERIVFIRGEKVMLDADLAQLYCVETSALNRAVKRNAARFPADFMFRLTLEEVENLKCQIGISSLPGSSGRHGGRRTVPFAFTEQGVAMLSGLLNSDRAIAVNIEIMRAFVRMRQVLAAHADLARQVDALERKYDAQFKVVFDAIRELMAPPASKSRRIGFT